MNLLVITKWTLMNCVRITNEMRREKNFSYVCEPVRISDNKKRKGIMHLNTNGSLAEVICIGKQKVLSAY